MFQIHIPACPIQSLIDRGGIQLDILREDFNHPLIQGNKFRKLKYNLMEARQKGFQTLLTFGGAYSNHIHATAAAGNAFGFKTIGIIRGEELASKPLNITLKEAKAFGMELEFINRTLYRQKKELSFLENLKQRYPDAYILPEGGTNELAVKGCEEILDERTQDYDYICLPVGTAGTISGIIKSSVDRQKILGFPALKNADFLKKEIENHTIRTNYDFINAYHFGGYAKFSSELIMFVNTFYQEFQIPLDTIYNGKMLFGIMGLIKKEYFPQNSRILAIHTGGLQGIRGFNETHQDKIKVNII
ncbi:pyridoxal-phosphate dependent enzyme [Flavobacteriaceae bacterium Ap0902]|nr:pyridoxal-phosphate dependent enzyme [Flavobacteriaceae bacterium Ap0902]